MTESNLKVSRYLRPILYIGVFFVIGFFTFAHANSAQATSKFWCPVGTTLGGTGTWDTTSSNWSASSACTSKTTFTSGTDTPIFDGAGGTVTLNSTISVVTGVTFQNASGYTISGTGTIAQSATGTTITLGTTGLSETINTIISGAIWNTAVTTGTDTLILGGANTFTGAFTIVSGLTLKLGAAGGATNTPLGTTGAGTTVNSGGALDLNGTTFGTAEALTINGTGVSSSGAIFNSNSTTAVWKGSVTAATSSTILGSTGALSFITGTMPLASGIVLTLDGTNTANAISQAIGTASTTGSIVKQGTGTWAVSGVNIFTGGCTIKNGTMQINVSNATSVSGGCGTTAGTITIGDSSGSLNSTLSAGAFTVSNPITAGATNTGVETITSTGNATFSGSITMNHDLTIAPAANTMAISTGTLSGSHNLTIASSGAGVATLSQTISMIGTITNNGGGGATNVISSIIPVSTVTSIIENSSTSALTLSGTSSAYVNGVVIKNGILNCNNANCAGTSASTITIGDSTGGSANATLNFGTAITNVSPISVAGTNTGVATITNGANSGTSGNITLSTHALTIASTSTFTMAISGQISGTGNITLSSASSGVITLSNATSIGNVGTITNSGSTATNVISGLLVASGVTEVIENSSSSALTLSGANVNYVNGVTVDLGTMNCGSTNCAGSGSSSINLGDGTSGNNAASFLVTTTGLTIPTPIVLVASTNGALSVGSGNIAAATFSGGVTGTNDFTIVNGRSAASGAVSFTTATINNIGKVTNTCPAASTGATTVGPSTGGIGTNVTQIIDNCATAGTFVISGPILDDHTDAAAADLSIINNNTGVLSVTGGITVGSGSGALTLQNNSTTAGGINIITGNVANSGSITNSGTGTGTVTIGIAITGTSSLIQNSTNSVLVLTGTNTYTTNTTITSGTLQANATAALGGASDTLIFNGGHLQATAAITSLSTRAVTMTGAGTIDTNGFAVSIAGNFSGSGALTKIGTATLTLTGTNTSFTGTVTITAGTLNANATGALGNGSSTNTLIFNGGTLQAAGTITSPSTRAVTLTSTALIDTNSQSISIAGTFSGAAGLTKSGTGTLTLSTTTNTISGTVTVSAGTLTNTAALTVGTNLTVSDGGTYTQGAAALTVDGNTTIGGGTTGIFNCAASAGTLSLVGNLTLSVNSTWTKTNCGTLTFKSGTTSQTLTDSTAGLQDLGTVQISSNTTNTTLTIQTSVKMTTLTVDASQTFSVGVGAFNVTISGDLTVNGTYCDGNSACTGSNTGTTTVNGNVVGTGAITLDSSTGFTQSVASAKNFGTTSGSTNWSFNNLTFSASPASTITTQAGTGTITVGASMTINTNATLDAGSRAWNITASGTAGSTQLVTDNFNRTNSTGLGANWTQVSTTATLNVSSNQALANAGTENGLEDFTGASWTGGNDQYAEAAIVALGSGNDMGPAVRVSGTTTANLNAYFFDINDTDAAISLGSSSFSVSIYKAVGGSYTKIGSSVTGVTVNANDVIRIEVQGTTIIGKINGSTIDTQTDASLSSGNPGLFTSSSTTNTWDNFAAGSIGSGGPFTMSGHFTANASTVNYEGTSATTITALTGADAYNNLSLIPASGTPTYTAAGATTVNGNFTNGGGGSAITFVAPSGNLTVGGNFTNNSTFTANAGTVVFTGSGTHTIAGATTFHNVSDTAASSTLAFTHGQIFTWDSGGVLTVTGGVSTQITITSDTTAVWLAHFTSAQSAVTNVIIIHSGCDTGTAAVTLDASATNNATATVNDTSCWNFPASGNVISGTLYSDDGVTAFNCSTHNIIIRVAKNGTLSQNVTCTLSGGTYTLPAVTSVSAGDVLSVFSDNSTYSFAAVTRASAANSTFTINLYQNRVILRHEDAGPITNTNVGQYDSASNANIKYTVSGGNLTVASGNKLIVWTGKTFTPGGTVTTTAASTAANPDGDVLIQGTATLSMGSNALSVGGDFVNSGTFSKSSGQTTTFTATGTGFGITNGTGTFGSLTFNGTGGDWTPTNATTVDTNLTMTAGSLLGTQNVTVSNGSATGAGIINLTGGTFLIDGTGNFGGTNVSNPWTFFNLTFGDGSGTTTTTTNGTAAVTVSNTMTVAANQTLDAGSITWNLTGSGSSTGYTLLASVKGHSGGDTNTFTTSAIDTTGADLLVMVVASATTSITPSDSKTNTWTQATQASGGQVDTIYYSWNPTSVGSGHTFTLTGTGIYGNIQVYAFSGSKTSANPLDQVNNAQLPGVTTIQPGSVTPTTDNQLIVTGDDHNTTTTATINSSFTSPAGAGTGFGDVFNSGGFEGAHSAYLVQGTAGAVNPTWTAGSGNHYATIATFKPAPAASTLVVAGTFTSNASTFNFKGTAATTIPALTGGNAYNNIAFKPASGTPTYTLGSATSQTITANGTFTVGDGSHGVTLLGGTFNPTINVTGAFQVSAGSAAFTSTSGTLTLGGNFTNNGTFTHNSGTIVFNGSGISTIGGSSSTTFNNVTDTTAGSTLKFANDAGGTTPKYTFAGTVTVTGSSGSHITITSDDGAHPWLGHFNNATSTITYATVSYSDCDVTSQVVTLGTDSTNAGNNNATATCWNFTVTGNVISGTLYSDDGSTAFNCATNNVIIRVAKNGTLSQNVTCSSAGGTYTLPAVTSVSAGDVLTVFGDNSTYKFAAITRASGANASVTANLYQNRVIVRHEDAGPITNANLGNYCGSGCTGNNANIPFTYGSSNVTISSGTKLIVWTGKTFTPGGTITTTAASTAANPDGDLQIQSGATLSMGTNALSIGGDFVNSGTFSKSTGQTTTFTATGTGFGITNGTGDFDSVTFNGSGGDWTPSNAMTLDANLTMTAGSLLGTQNVTVNGGGVTGNGTINLTGGTFLVRGTGNFGGSANWTFNDLKFGNSYTTNFPATENPISESSNWINGAATGLDWYDAQTTPGKAFGNQTTGSYTDPTAALTGTWGADQSAQATVFCTNPTASYYQEVELRLRTTVAAHSITGYEILFRCLKTAAAYAGIVRWNGPVGQFTEIDPGWNGSSYGVQTGDVVKATIVGSTITAYINGSSIGSVTDSTYTTGNPGIGFNFGVSTTYTDFGFSTYTATDNPSGATSTSTGTGGVTVSDVMTIAANQTLDTKGKTWTLSGTTGTPLVINGTLSDSASTSTIAFTGNNGSGNTTVPVSAGYNNITLNNGSETFNLGGNITIAGNLTVTAGTLSDTHNVTVNGGGATGAGTVNLTGGTFTLAGTGNFGGTTNWTFNNLTFSGTTTATSTSTITVPGTLTISGSSSLNGGSKTWLLSKSGASGSRPFINSGTFTPATSTVDYEGTAATDVETGGTSISYNNLNVGSTSDSGTGVTYTLNGSVTVAGVLTVGNSGSTNADTLAAGANTLTLSGTGTPLTLAASAKGLFSDGTSTVIYTGSGTVAATTFYNLTFGSGSSITVTMPGSAINIGNNLAISNNASVTKGAGTVTFNKGAAQTWTDSNATAQDIGAVATATGSTNLQLGSSVKATSLNFIATTTFTPGANTLELTGSSTPFTVGGTFTPTSSTIKYSGATPTVTATTYNNLTLGGTGTYTTPASGSNITLRGNLVVTSGASITKGASGGGIFIFAIGGGSTQNWTDNNGTSQDIGPVQISANTGNSTLSLSSSVAATSITIDSSQTFTVGANTLTLTAPSSIITGSFTPSSGSTIAYVPSQASGTVTLPSSITYYNLTLNKSSNTFAAPSGTLTINNNLNATAGTLDLSANNPTVTVAGTTTIGGTLISTSGNLTLNGDFTNNGTFTHNSGTVILAPTGNSIQILGTSNTTFYNLTDTTAGKAVIVKFGNTLTVNNNLTLTGTASGIIAVKSTTGGSQWTINLVASSNGSVHFISVIDTACSGNNISTPNDTILNLGNNGTCWGFISKGGGGVIGGGGNGGSSGGGSANNTCTVDCSAGASNGDVGSGGTNLALVQSIAQTVSSGTTNALAFSSNNTAGNLIIAFVVWDNTGTATVSDGNGTYTAVGSPTTWNTNKSAQIFYMKNIAAGANTVTATFGTTITSFGKLYIHEYSGLDTSSPFDQTHAGTGNSTALDSGSVTDTVDRDLVFGGAASAAVVNTQGTNFTSRRTDFSNMTEDKATATVGSYNASATATTGQWVMIVATFKASGQGGGQGGGGGGGSP